jgi:MarR family 2-MHQ and catechol resistance regulon transcriptional repressor
MDSELAERIVVGVFRLSGLLTKTGNRLAGRLNLTQQKWVLLAALDKHGECVLSQLGESLLVTKANITGMVDRLERDGLVERRRDPQDRRLWWVRLTQAGREALTAMNQIQAEWLNRCFEGLDEKEMRAFLGTLKELFGAVRETEAGPEKVAARQAD